MTRRFRTLGAGLAADARRGIAVATGAIAAVAVVELVATLVAYPGPLRAGAVARLVPLDATLCALAWLVIAPVAAGIALAPRLLVRAWRGAEAARAYPGAGVEPLPGRTVAWAWGIAIAAALYVYWSSAATFAATETYKEYRLMAILLALRQVVAIGILGAVAVALGALADRVRRRVDRLLGARLAMLNPLGRPVPALILVAAGVVVALLVAAHRLPQLRPLVPWRWMIAGGAAFAGGALALARIRRGPLLPGDRARRRRVALGAAAAALVIVPVTLVRLGGHVDTKGMAISASPVLERLIAVVRTANDLDRDGFGSLLGENDCAPLDARIRPGARDEPDNGVDENCNGKDSSLRDLIAPTGERMAVPEAFQRDWNVLLLTIDTVRYDHTSFGGYVEKKKRDTTPRLAELVDRSVSFTFANAPSAGTMASVPAILTSKFFHSGLALDEKRKAKMPPKLKPENVTLPEIMKRGGYTTGAILSHEYFNDWGMEQGVDHYDNEIGKKPDAFRISSQDSTDRAIAWISSHASRKWFLWVHYLDPHGRYVAHPEGPDWGSTEEDLYDGELRYTDQHVGRLLDELARLPGGDRTIVVITSDHGDAFGEHGFTNHGQALYRELLHVPLIVYVPDLPAREVGGAVSPLDVVPTIADLCGIDVSDLSFEGRSLVPQIFYGKEDPARVVFAETNYPKPLRAAVSSRYKLVYDLQNNLHQLFDLEADPWEKSNLASKDPAALAAMREHLDAWLERVMFARDPVFNQATGKVAGVLLDARPSPANAASGSFDGGAIEVLGFEVQKPLRAGEKVPVAVYFAVEARPSGSFKLQLHGWLGTKVAKSAAKTPAEGYLPTDRWRPGEFIKETLELKVPADWSAAPESTVTLGLAMSDKAGKVRMTGSAAPGDAGVLLLGEATLEKPSVDAGLPVKGALAPVPP